MLLLCLLTGSMVNTNGIVGYVAIWNETHSIKKENLKTPVSSRFRGSTIKFISCRDRETPNFRIIMIVVHR